MMKYSRIIACCLLICMFTCSFASAEVLNKPTESAALNANNTNTGLLKTLTVSISANPNPVLSGQTTQVKFYVSSGGKPVGGAGIYNISSAGVAGAISSGLYLGGFDKETGTTDVNGNFIATYTSPTFWSPIGAASAQYQLDAMVYKTGYNARVGKGELTIQPLPLQPLTYSVSASPSTVLSGQSSQVKVHVDSSGKPVDGVNIKIWIDDDGSGTLDNKTGIIEGTSNANGDLALTYKAPIVSLQGQYVVQVSASKDGYNLVAGNSSTIIVLPAAPPTPTPTPSPAPTPNPTPAATTPDLPGALAQYKSDGVTRLAFSGTTTENSVAMKGTVSDPSGGQVQLEVEAVPVGNAFTGIPTSSSALIASGSTASVICKSLVDGKYHWQARAKNTNGIAGPWLSVGSASKTAADFIVQTTPIVDPTRLKPVAKIGANVTEGAAPLTIRFSDLSQGETSGRIWMFGDNRKSQSILRNPIHTFAKEGQYTVTLKVKNRKGTDSARLLINVTKPVPPDTGTTTAGKEIWLASGPRLVISTKFSDDKVTWYETASNGLHVYDLKAGKEASVPQGIGTNSNIIVSGNRMVWTGMDGSIKLYDFISGVKTDISDEGNDPYIGGNYVAYVKNGIYLYDVGTKQEKVIVPVASDEYCSSPIVNGDHIVWSKQTGTGGSYVSDTYLYDIATGQTTKLSTGGKAGVEDISGDVVVWSELQGIFMYDLKTQKMTHVTQDGKANSPAIYGNRIVYVVSDAAGDRANTDVYMYDISTAKTTRITTSKTAYSPSIYKDKIAYADSRKDPINHEDADIYLYDLTA
jgi:beta propeller repeat protein